MKVIIEVNEELIECLKTAARGCRYHAKRIETDESCCYIGNPQKDMVEYYESAEMLESLIEELKE